MAKLRIGVIVGSIREGRFAEKAATWIAAQAASRPDIEVETVDLKDYPMPFFAEPVSPAWGEVADETARRWQAKLSSFDGFVITAAEYNHAPTAVLKNALDYAYGEWGRKPVAFVGYGGVGGARAVEQLRQIAIELQMAPVKSAVHVLLPDFMVLRSGEREFSDLDHLGKSASDMLDQLVWWGRALRDAREAEAARKAA